MDSFVLVLAEHLHDEIDSLHPDKIEKVGKKEDERIRSDVLAHLKKYDPAWFLCAAMSGFRALHPTASSRSSSYCRSFLLPTLLVEQWTRNHMMQSPASDRQVAHPPLPHPACLPNEEIKKALPLPWIVRRVLVPVSLPYCAILAP